MKLEHPVAVHVARELLGRLLDLEAHVNAFAEKARSEKLSAEFWELVEVLDVAVCGLDELMPAEIHDCSVREAAVAGWQRARRATCH